MKVNSTIKAAFVGMLMFSGNAFSQTYTFSTAGATGVAGPTQAQINTAYAATNLNGLVADTNGIQYWTVPASGLYKIEATGAGGYGTFAGRGAKMSGVFSLAAGTQLKILVGQKGGCCVGSGTNQYGGGGGTFVATNANVPLIVAGGGGGANGNAALSPNADASTTTSGKNGMGSANGMGGINGNGGEGVSSAGGGGGFMTDGGVTGGNPGGFAFVNGGGGGTTTSNGGWGGFGGGGGANSWDNRRGGGGGGYSGGGSAGSSTSAPEIGGGGGSYNAGLAQVNTEGVGTADGSVVITVTAATPNNTGVAAFVNPSGNVCSGPQNIIVKVTNLGNTPVDSVKVAWQIDGVLQSSNWYQVNLSPVTGTNFQTNVTVGSYNFTGGSHNFKAWTSLPNNQPDTSNSNDTAWLSMGVKMQGTYTINSAVATGGTNFQSYNAFATALNTYGICGPVVANAAIGSGPYVETVTFGDIDGASAINTIRINGNGTTIQTTPTGTADNKLITLNSTKYMTIDSVKVKTLDATYGWGIWITGNATKDSILRCNVDLSTITGTASANANGIVVSGSATSPTSTCPANNIYIGNNKVVAGGTAAGGGYYGISFYGMSSTAQNDSVFIVNNEVTNFYYYGINYYYVKGGEVSGNNVHRITKTAIGTSCYAIQVYYCLGVNVTRNRIHDLAAPGVTSTSTFYGLRAYDYNNTAATPITVANNVVYNMGNYTGTQYLSYIYGPSHNVYHNTIDASVIQTGTSTSSMYGMYIGVYTGTNIMNNIVNITGGNLGTKYGLYFSGSYVGDIQKNDINVVSPQAGTMTPYYYTTAFASLAAFQTANPTLEVGSPSVDPQFTMSATGDFTPSNTAVLSAGVNLLTDVPSDINFLPRSATPTLGAFESLPTNVNDAAMQSFISPVDNICAAPVPVEVIFRNAGTNNLNSVHINWTVNGVLQTPYTYSGVLTPSTATTGQNSDTVILGNASLVSGNNVIRVWTSLPNNTTDPQSSNDTIVLNFATTNFHVAANADTMCANGVSILDISPSTGYGAGVIQWQSSTNGTTWNSISGANATSYIVNGLSATTQFRAQVTNYGTTCISTKDTINVVDPQLVSTTPASRCGPGTLTLGATGTPGSILKWYNASTGGTPLNIGTSYTTPVLTSSATYYVAAANSANSADSVAVPLSSGTTTGVYHHMFLVSSTTGMTVNKIALKVNSAVGTATAWDVYYRPDNYQLVAGANTSATGWTLLSSNTNAISAGGLDYAEIASNLNLTIPAGATYSLYIAPGNTASTHQYSAAAIGTVMGSNGTSSIIAGNRGSSLFNCTSSGGQAVVKLVSSSGCESNRVAVAATIHDYPVVSLGNDTLICPGTSTTLNGTSATATTYSWSTGATTPTISVNTAGAYVVTVGNGFCQAKDTVNVGIAPVPSGNLMDTVTICTGNTATLNAGNTGATYNWSTGSTNQSIQVQNSGSYKVTVTNNFHCSTSDSSYLVTNPLPVVNLGNDTIVCGGTPLTLDAQNPGYTYMWSTGDTTQTINITTGGTYTVAVTNEYGCTASDAVNINEFTPVAVDGINFIPRYDSQQGRVDFFPINPSLVDSFHWDFGDGGTSTLENPIHVYQTSANYLVTLSISNECGSKDTSIMIYVDLFLGVKAVGGENINVDVFPVPANNDITIETKTADLKLVSVAMYNAVGQEVINLKNINSQSANVNLNDLVSGNYFIKIETNKGTTFRRFNISR